MRDGCTIGAVLEVKKEICGYVTREHITRKGKMSFRVALLVTLFTMFTHTVKSPGQEPDASLQTLTRSQSYQELVHRTLGELPPTVFQRCPSLVSSGSTVTVINPVSFAKSGHPNTGSWKQAFPVSGCGNDTVLHIYFTATPDEKITATVGLPGSTHADLTLQWNSVMYAQTGARHVVKDCNHFDVRNTKFESYGLVEPPTPDPGPGNGRRPWWETWTMIGCGQIIDVPIDFVPDATGTTIIQPGGATKR
jgi:hypothetical protein